MVEMNISNTNLHEYDANNPETEAEKTARSDSAREDEAEWDYACVFCRSRSENDLKLSLDILFPGAEAFVPQKLRRRRKQGEMITETAVLFPGYLFCKVPKNEEISLYSLGYRLPDSIKLLKDSNMNWRLHGADRRFAELVFREKGVFGYSKACFIDGRMHILEGPLFGYDDLITKVNRRFKTCEITVSVHGREEKIWLGYEEENETGELSDSPPEIPFGK